MVLSKLGNPRKTLAKLHEFGGRELQDQKYSCSDKKLKDTHAYPALDWKRKGRSAPPGILCERLTIGSGCGCFRA